MTLADLIRGRRNPADVELATATPATLATVPTFAPSSVATVATVAVANPWKLGSEDPDPLWGRVAILEPGGRTVEVDTPSGWTLPDWQAYAERYHGSGCAVTPIAGLPKPRGHRSTSMRPLEAACEGMAGITPAQFRTLLSPEDIADIEAGAIHPTILKAYALSFAEGIRSGRIAALPERKGAKPAPLWGSVAITEAEIEAARKGCTVVRQGTFAGSQEVKG